MNEMNQQCLSLLSENARPIDPSIKCLIDGQN